MELIFNSEYKLHVCNSRRIRQTGGLGKVGDKSVQIGKKNRTEEERWIQRKSEREAEKEKGKNNKERAGMGGS